jgi:hypothetical protein
LLLSKCVHSLSSRQRTRDRELKPVIARYQGKVSRIYFRADAGFEPAVYEFLEAERIRYAIRLPANQVLQSRIGYLLKRPVARPPNEVRRFHANFTYRAGSWTKPRRVIAKVEWHPGELYPRVGFIVTNLSRPAERVVAFYNKRGTCEQWIKEGKGAIKWTRLSCRTFAANAVRLQLHALAYNLGNFLRTLATIEPIKDVRRSPPFGPAPHDRQARRWMEAPRGIRSATCSTARSSETLILSPRNIAFQPGLSARSSSKLKVWSVIRFMV